MSLKRSFILFFLAGIQAFAQIKTTGRHTLSNEALDNFIMAQMDSLQLPGLSVAIINDGKIVYQRAFGQANIEKKISVTEASIFEAASLSKPVFTSFVMKVVEKGMLNLDTPLYTYLPYPDIENDERYKLITARMVLTHKTGFPNWRWFEKADSSLHVKHGDLYLKFTPGTSFAYSGEGFFYLSKVIAHLYHTDIRGLDSVFQREIAQPQQLNQLYFSGNSDISENKVSGYKKGKLSNKKWPVSFPTQDSTWFGAAGGLHTNAVNYANFLIALINNKIVSERSTKEMFSPQIRFSATDVMYKEDGTTAWGLGIALKETSSGLIQHHGGNNGDFQSGFAINYKKKWGYVFFTNCDNGNAFNKKLQKFLLR